MSIPTVQIAHCITRDIAGDAGLEDTIFAVARDTLREAGISRPALDGIVIGTGDLPEGRVIQSMVTAGAAGAVGKPLMTVASSSDHALVVAALQMLAGLATSLLVISWSKTAESRDYERAESFGTDPIYNRSFGLTPVVAAALVKSAASGPGAERAASSVEPDDAVPYPLVKADVPPVVDAVTATVLTAGDGQSMCALRGVGWSSTTLDLSLRGEPLEAVRTAARAAYEMADLPAPIPASTHVVRIQSGASMLGAPMAEAAHIVGWEAADSLPALPHASRGFVGGLATINRVAEALASAEGGSRALIGIAVCASGFYAQNASVVVLERIQPS